MKYEQEIIDELWLEYCRKHWPRPKGIKPEMSFQEMINQLTRTLTIDIQDGIQYIIEHYPGGHA